MTTRMVLGWMLSLLGRDSEARRQYRAVPALDPDNDEARRRLVGPVRGPRARAPRRAGRGWWAAQAEQLQSTGLLD